MQIIILGMHRSGTSMVARALNLMGAYLGEADELVPAAPDNTSGFWERKDVVALSTQVFRATGAEWFAPLEFDPERLDPAVRAACTDRLRAVIGLLDRRAPWALKDPRMCLMLPLWRPHLARPVFVIAHRHPLEVAKSLAERDFFDLEFGLALWEAYTVASLAGSCGAPRVLVSYNACLRDPEAALRKLYDDLVAAGVNGLRWPGRDNLGLVQSRLQHQVASADEVSLLSPAQLRLQRALESGEALRPDFACELSAEARAVMTKYRARVHRLQAKLRQLLDRTKERDRLLGELVLTGRELTASHTWRTGNLLIGWLRRRAMRGQPDAEWPEDHVERLAREIEAMWREEGRLDKD